MRHQNVDSKVVMRLSSRDYHFTLLTITTLTLTSMITERLPLIFRC